MARPLRIQYPGAFYHITSRGNERKAIFRSKRDRERFIFYLESASERYGAVIYVYCLMDNHYDLLLETPLGNLSQILHHINGTYTAYFNAKRRRFGHLFQGRYKAISEYPWSSYAYYVGKQKTPAWLQTDFVLGYFGDNASKARKRYRRFVEGAAGPDTQAPLEEVFASTFLGSEAFIAWVKDTFIGKERADMRNIPALREMIDRPSLEEIEKATELMIGKEHRLRKSLCLFVSHQYGGFRLKEIGAYYGMRGSAVSQSSRRFKKRLGVDDKLRHTVAEIVKQLRFVES